MITIGDSQTYGSNVQMEANWPSRLMRRLSHKDAVVYNMATGGWGAVQYLGIFEKALAFRPKLVIVAFYAGNDPRESFRAAYSIEKWAWLQPDPELDLSDQPAVKYPPQPDEQWRVRLKREEHVLFRPRLRLASSQDDPTVDAGWAIMAEVARHIASAAQAQGVPTLFTVLPTKETAFARRLRREGVALDPVYEELVKEERRRTHQLAASLSSLEGADYMDLVAPLQAVILKGVFAYPPGSDGHPTPAGHAVIAQVLAAGADLLLPAAKPRIAERP